MQNRPLVRWSLKPVNAILCSVLAQLDAPDSLDNQQERDDYGAEDYE